MEEGGKKKMARSSKRGSEGDVKERHQKEIDSNPAKLTQRERGKQTDGEVGKLFDPTLGIRFTAEIPPVQHGKRGESLFQALLLFVMPGSISGQSEAFAVL